MKKLLFTIPILLTLLVWMFYSGNLRTNYPNRREYPIHGLDVSHHQGTISWEEIQTDKFQFVYMKATEGGDWVDTQFHRNWKESSKTKLKRGAYHFYRLCKTGKEQAANFINEVPYEEHSLPHVVDLESIEECSPILSGKDLIKEISDYLMIVGKHYKKRPIIYTTYEFYYRYLYDSGISSPIWIRDIWKKPRLKNSQEWIIWQYSNRGKISGINGYVDLNAVSKEHKHLFE